MNDIAKPGLSKPATGSDTIPARTVQQYIDELPVWPDGTRLKTSPMTGMQLRIWSLAATGKFFEGYVVFMTGVALPLITHQFNIPSGVNGIISAASLAGILFGSVLLGGLSRGFGKGAQHLPPTVSGRPDLGVDRVDHQVEQFLLGGDVAVQPHRPDVQRRGDLAQRHRHQAVRVGQLDRRSNDPLPAQRGQHRPIRRLRPLPHQHAADNTAPE